MYQTNSSKERLNRIVEDSVFSTDTILNERVKSLLCQTINELCDYTEQNMRQIEERVMRLDCNIPIGEIVCALVPKRDVKNYIGLSEMSVPVQDTNIVFIDKDYEELRKSVGDQDTERNYEGFYIADGEKHVFRYQLKFYDKYIKLENLIFKLAEYYQVENPIIFSPFSRKAFRIVYMDDIPKNVVSKDFQFEKYALNVIEHVTLLWNFNVARLEQMTCIEKVPYGNSIQYHYFIEKSKEGNYYYMLPEHNQVIVYDVHFSDKGTEIWINHECEDFTVMEWTTVDWNMPEIERLRSRGKIFSNKVKKLPYQNKKIISMCDIEHAIYPFRYHIGIKCSLTEHLEKIFLRYSAKYRNLMAYHKVNYKALKRVMVCFDGNMEYIDDYANYVLQYLEYYYPEIEWVGGW